MARFKILRLVHLDFFFLEKNLNEPTDFDILIFRVTFKLSVLDLRIFLLGLLNLGISKRGHDHPGFHTFCTFHQAFGSSFILRS